MDKNEVVQEKIRTFVRQRPALPDEPVPQSTNPPPPPTFLGGGIAVDDDCLDVTETSICYTANDQQRCYEVDGGFDGDGTQAEVYEATARSIVDAVGSGYNGTILAYGQTGSGKTHTMRGGISVSEAGITPRALLQLFELQKQSDATLTFSLSYVQIYCERLSDLLGNDTDELSIRDRPAHDGGGVYVRNATRVPVTTPRQALDLLAAGDSKRATASTLMNEFSSRSHAVALLHVERKTKDSLQRSTLTLVDLAGSERHAACAGRYKRLEESRAINLGLSALGNCVSALAERRPHVPYRDSKLTRLLQASLGGTARTALIACCAPGGDATGETKSTLEFAARARKVVVRAAPRDVAVDYQSLYEEVKDSIDDYRTRERKALDEVESLKDKEEATQSRILELERENDALKHALQRQQRPVVEGDQVDVIEQLHAKFNDDTEEAERRHAAELRTAQSRADAKIKAYRDAAEVSARECDAAEAALTGEREGHLASLKELRRVKAEFRETEARHAARVSELIEEVAAAKGEGEAKAQEADKAADALLKRVETLEVSRQEQLETDYVSRDAVAEMEKLFRSTIDALAARLEDLEGKRVSDVAAGRSRGRVSAGARAVLESLDAGEDLPPLHERFGGRRRAKPLATQNMPRAPPRRRVSAKPAIPRFY